MTAHNLVKALFTFQLIFLSNPMIFSAGSSKNEDNKNDSGIVIIEGKIDKGSADTVLLFLQKEFIYNYIGRENYQMVCDSNGLFKFMLHISHPAKISLFLNGDTKVLFNNFYIMPGDVISAAITKGETENIIFSGTGSEKFKCMYSLDSNRRNPVKAEASLDPSLSGAGISIAHKLLRSFKRADQYGDYFFSILSKYRGKICPEIFKLLTADIAGEVATIKCYHVLQSLQHASVTQEREIYRLFFQKVYCPLEKLNDSIIVYSEKYIEYLMRRSQIKLSKDVVDYSMKDMVILIERDYSGILRARLLTYYLLGPKIGVNNQEYEYCLKRSIIGTKSMLYSKYLKAQLEKFSTGTPAYNFSLPDSSGRYFSLSEFKGKVVLIDFWFTGCSACIGLSKDLVKNVIPKFKEDPVVFISISLDKEKTNWTKSIKSGLYTSAHSINLFTEGAGFAHPLITHYNIQGCPALLLIDKEGKIAEARPQWDPEKLRVEIDAAIKKESRSH